MKTYAWENEKNDWLINERGISFERIINIIENDGLLDIIKHPNTERYPNQRMLIVNINEYAYLVPFVESHEEIFLKTVIPSRKATKKYIGAK